MATSSFQRAFEQEITHGSCRGHRFWPLHWIGGLRYGWKKNLGCPTRYPSTYRPLPGLGNWYWYNLVETLRAGGGGGCSTLATEPHNLGFRGAQKQY